MTARAVLFLFNVIEIDSLRASPTSEFSHSLGQNRKVLKAELEIELLHEKIDQLREREVVKLTEAVRMLTELLEQSASGARESDAEGGRPS